jgi:hypothetical protein
MQAVFDKEIDELIVVQALSFRDNWRKFLEIITPSKVRDDFFVGFDYLKDILGPNYLESLLRAATTGEFNRLYEITNKTTDRFIEQQATFCLDTFRDLSKSNKDEANNLLIFLDAGADKILRKIKDM